MKVYINECSIVGQASNEIEAMDILFNLASVIAKTRDISFERKAYRTNTLGNKAITGNLTVKEVLVSSSNKAHVADERQRKLVIEVLLKKPYAEYSHISDQDSITDSTGNCLKKSCFDAAATSIGSPLTVSAKNCLAYQMTSIDVNSSIYGKKTILNVSDELSLKSIKWIFEHNPKHKITEYQVAGERVSVMDLSVAEAQLALNNGIKINSKVYSYFNNSWYQFHCHQGNAYHGFKIELEENKPEHMKALSVFKSLNHGAYGQVIL